MYQLGKNVTHPFFLLSLILGLMLVRHWYRQRTEAKRLLGLAVVYVTLIVLCLPIVGYWAIGSLEWQYPFLEQRPADAQAIVVLGGGENFSLARCLRAAEVYQQGKRCPVLYCAGPDVETQQEGTKMHGWLVQLGVHPTDLIADLQSLNTYENAREARRLLEKRNIHHLMLVTDAAHMPRAVRCFRKQGFAVVPAPCEGATARFRQSILVYFPSPSAARCTDYAAQEWLGLAWYWLCGRI